MAWLCRMRGVEDPCPTCRGSGVKVYGSTATWHGGIGGAMMSRDVCDTCWGSGDEHRKGADLRALEGRIRAAEARARLSDLAEVCGATLKSFAPAIERVCDELEKMSGWRYSRRELPAMFSDACSLLARRLREGVEAARSRL
jgi:hypothetical protein